MTNIQAYRGVSINVASEEAEGHMDGVDAMATQHTPGPWKVGQTFTFHGVTFLSINHEDGSPIAQTLPIACGREQALANARLIAAAPETARERDGLRGQLDWALRREQGLIRSENNLVEKLSKAETQRDELLAALKWALPHVLKREGWIKPSSEGDMAGSIPKETRDDMAAKYSVFKAGLDAMKAAIANAGTK